MLITITRWGYELMKSKKLAIFAASCSLVFTNLALGETLLSAKAETSLQPELQMKVTSRYDSGVQNEDGGATEIISYNTDNQKYYVINGTTKQLEVVKLPSNAIFTELKAEKTINLEASLKKQSQTLYMEMSQVLALIPI